MDDQFQICVLMNETRYADFASRHLSDARHLSDETPNQTLSAQRENSGCVTSQADETDQTKQTEQADETEAEISELQCESESNVLNADESTADNVETFPTDFMYHGVRVRQCSVRQKNRFREVTLACQRNSPRRIKCPVEHFSHLMQTLNSGRPNRRDQFVAEYKHKTGVDISNIDWDNVVFVPWGK